MQATKDRNPFIGHVTEVDFESTQESGAAQLEFQVASLAPDGQAKSFIVQTSAPASALAAMTALVAIAYASQLVVSITYDPSKPDEATNVRLPDKPPNKRTGSDLPRTKGAEAPASRNRAGQGVAITNQWASTARRLSSNSL
jgi:hypothetical protein